MRPSSMLALAGIALYAVAGTPAFAQPPAPATSPAPPAGAEQQALAQLPPIQFCGQQAAAPRAQPPSSSGPVVLAFGPCFEAQGGSSVIEPQTYLYYINLRQSRPSENVWVAYNHATVS